MLRQTQGLGIDTEATCDHQRDTAAGSLRIKGREPFKATRHVLQTRVHGAHQDAIFQGHRP